MTDTPFLARKDCLESWCYPLATFPSYAELWKVLRLPQIGNVSTPSTSDYPTAELARPFRRTSFSTVQALAMEQSSGWNDPSGAKRNVLPMVRAPNSYLSSRLTLSSDPQVIYSTATVPFPDRLRDNLPLFNHSDHPGGYRRLSYLKVLVPGPKDNRMIIFYRIEGDRRKHPGGALCPP